METYSEIKGAVPFDWNAFLAKEEYSKNELVDANRRASRWVTCAVGNQCSIIKRDQFGEPLDWELTSLGVYFAEAINGIMLSSKHFENNEAYFNEYKTNAVSTIKRIEERSAILIHQLKNNPNV